MLKKISYGVFFAVVATFCRVLFSIWAVNIIFSLLNPEYKIYSPVAVLVLITFSYFTSKTYEKTYKITEDDFIENIAEGFGKSIGAGFSLCSILLVTKYIVIWFYGL